MGNNRKRSRGSDECELPIKRLRSQPKRTAANASKPPPIKAAATGKRVLRATGAGSNLVKLASATAATSSSLPTPSQSTIPNSVTFAVNHCTTITCDRRLIGIDRKYKSEQLRMLDLFEDTTMLAVYGSPCYIYCLACKQAVKLDPRGTGIYNLEPYEKHRHTEHHLRNRETWRASGGEEQERPVVMLETNDDEDQGVQVKPKDLPKYIKHEHKAKSSRAKTTLLEFETGSDSNGTFYTIILSKSGNKKSKTGMVQQLVMKIILERTTPSPELPVKTESLVNANEVQEEHSHIPARLNKKLRSQAMAQLSSFRVVRESSSQNDSVPAPQKADADDRVPATHQALPLASDSLPRVEVPEDHQTETESRSPSPYSFFQPELFEDGASEAYTTPAREFSVLGDEDQCEEQGAANESSEMQRAVARGVSTRKTYELVTAASVEDEDENEVEGVVQPWEVEVRTGIDTRVPESFCRTHI